MDFGDCIDSSEARSRPLEIDALPLNHMMRVHLNRANSALAWIAMKRKAENPNASTTTSNIDATNDDTASIRRTRSPYHFHEQCLVVPVRSNLRIDGYGDIIAGSENDTPALREDRSRQHKVQRNATLVFCSLYGAAHLLAWNNHFPSGIEKWLWRASALCMTICTPSITVCLIADTLNEWLIGEKAFDRASTVRPRFTASKERKVLAYLTSKPLSLIFTILSFATVSGYTLARLYVLVEAIIALRSTPDGTYTAISWTKFFPHVA